MIEQQNNPIKNVDAAAEQGVDVNAAQAASPSMSALEFLKAFHPEGPWCLSAISVDKKQAILTKTFYPGDEGKCQAFIDQHNGTRNLYFIVNPVKQAVQKKPDRSQIRAVEWLHVDVDPRVNEPLDEEYKRIASLFGDRSPEGVPEPTVHVFTGGGQQGFWKLDQPLLIEGETDDELVQNAEQAGLWNKRLSQEFGGDHCHSIDHLMRLPGTWNIPNAKKAAQGRTKVMAEVISAEWDRTYSLTKDFAQAKEPSSDTHNASKNATVELPDDVPRLESLDELASHVAEGKTLPERLLTIIAHGFNPKETNKPHEDRSRWVLDVACGLVRAGVPDAIICSVLTDERFRISAHVLEQKKVRRYVVRQIERAKERVGQEQESFHQDEKGKILSKSQHNIRVALAKLGCEVQLDEFRSRRIVHGLGPGAIYLDDTYLNHLRLKIDEQFGFLVPEVHFFNVVSEIAFQNRFHPVRDYFDSLEWDMTPRLQNWLSAYAGAKDTPFVRAIGKLLLLAAVRRVRQPGCKFDEMVVLEGGQGTGKSTALRILAINDEWFTDEVPLHGSGKEAIEALSGKLIVEAAELKGMSAGKVEHLKAFVSRQVDRARLSYGRVTTEMPRQCVLVGSTNSDAYLMDSTGNRRFWPVKIECFDLDALRRDRDQLWAEAVYWEAKDESIRLDPDLWNAAAAEQQARQLKDPFEVTLHTRLDGLKGKILVEDVLRLLEIPTGQRRSDHNRRMGEAMAALGWERKRLRRDGRSVYAYINCPPDGAPWIDVDADDERVPRAHFALERQEAVAISETLPERPG